MLAYTSKKSKNILLDILSTINNYFLIDHVMNLISVFKIKVFVEYSKDLNSYGHQIFNTYTPTNFLTMH